MKSVSQSLLISSLLELECIQKTLFFCSLLLPLYFTLSFSLYFTLSFSLYFTLGCPNLDTFDTLELIKNCNNSFTDKESIVYKSRCNSFEAGEKHVYILILESRGQKVIDVKNTSLENIWKEIFQKIPQWHSLYGTLPLLILFILLQFHLSGYYRQELISTGMHYFYRNIINTIKYFSKIMSYNHINN